MGNLEETGGDSTGRKGEGGSGAGLLLAATAVVVAIAVIMAVVLLAPSAPAETKARYAFRDGDRLEYVIAGTLHGVNTTGTYNMTLSDVRNGFPTACTTTLNVSDQSLWSNVSKPHLPSLSLFGYDIGSGRYATPFGPKEVKWSFRAHPGGLFEIDYYALDPFVVYGGVINGADTHVSFVLNGTTNPYVTENNTKAIVYRPDTVPKDPSGAFTVKDIRDATFVLPAYHPSGGTLRFNISTVAYDADIYVFSDGNIRSMGEGGPFAYQLERSRLGAGNASLTLTMPPGHFMVSVICHGPAQNQTATATLDYSVSWGD